MSPFTLGYLARIELWAFAAVMVQGGLVLGSWLAWSRATTRAAATLRHRLACAHLAALAAAPVLTVAVLHWTVATQAGGPVHGAPAAELPTPGTGYGGGVRVALPLAILWSAGVAAMLSRLGADARRLARLRREPAPAALAATVRRLTRGWPGAACPEVWVVAARAPQVAGLWRPMLLAPPDLDQRLSPVEQEAVLLHELAHVRQGDFGWNLLQRLVLAFFWFHPAAWRLYADVSSEREGRCDALAVRHGASASGLARALVRLAQPQDCGGVAMAFSRQSGLTARVRRLLDLDPPSPRPRGSRAAAMAASALCLGALAAGRLGQADPSIADLYAASAFAPAVSILAHDAAGAFGLRVRRGRVVEATVERRLLPKNQILQDGERVTLLGAGSEPLVALTITPQGRIRWKARG